MELGHFNKHFVKNTTKKAPHGKILEFFSQILLKEHFEKYIKPKDGQNQGLLFQNQGTYSIFKKGQRRPCPPLPPISPCYV